MRLLLAFVLILGLVPAAARAAVEPVTISYVADGKTIELGGWLYVPEGVGPFPAQVLMHGCSGVEKNHHAWAKRLAERGYVALIVEGFRSRGIEHVCTTANFYKVSYGARIADAYAGAAFLRARRDVDGARLGVIGWSHGGIIALKLATAQPKSLPGTDLPVVHFRSAVAFYPTCRYPDDIVIPLLILIGASDDWTPVEKCQGFEKVQRSIGSPIELVVYEGAYHSFDAEAVGDGLEFFGYHLQYDAAATKDAEARLFAFLERTLGD